MYVIPLLLIYRLGHREQKDEWVPRRVEIFQKHNVLPPDAIVSAGSVNSACTAGIVCPVICVWKLIVWLKISLVIGKVKVFSFVMKGEVGVKGKGEVAALL